MKFCEKCGKQLFDEAVVCPGCGCPTAKPVNVPPVAPKNLCRHCGKEVPTGAAVCMNCGCPVAPVAATGPTIAKNKYKHNLDAIIYSVLGALSILFLFIEGFCMTETPYYYESTSYADLVAGAYDDDTSIAMTVICAIAVAAILAFSWISFGMKRSFAIANVISSAVLACTVISSSIFSAVNYGYSRYTFGWFNSFSILFYIELIVLLGLVALSILNLCGIYLIKMPTARKQSW